MLNNKGTGFAFAIDETNNLLLPLAKISVGVAEESESDTSSGSPYFGIAPQQVYDTLTTSEETTITVEIEQVVGEEQIGMFAYNQKPGNAGGTVSLPVYDGITVSTAAVTVTGLTLDQPVQACLISNTSGLVHLTQVQSTTGVATANEFSVDADTLTFHASIVGSDTKVAIAYFKGYTKKYIGGPNPVQGYENIGISTRYQLTKMQPRFFYAPQCKSATGAAITFGPNDSISRDFIATLKTGWNKPYIDGEVEL